MRSDMKKVLCERPRWGSHDGYHQARAATKQTDPDDLPSHEGMRRPHNTKSFSDLLGPLARFMRRSVGRRYDEVWSELCANVPGDTTTGDHLREHARSMCETNTFVSDGKVLSRGRYGFGSAHEADGLYVDPRDGLIYYKEPKPIRSYNPVVVDGLTYRLGDDGIHYPYGWARQKKGVHPLKVIGDKRAMKIVGIWYWIERTPVPLPVIVGYVEDGVAKQRVVYPACRDIITGEIVKEGAYYSDKRQMCSRDLRRYGLRND